MQAGFFQVVTAGHAADGDHATDMFDGGGQGHRHDEQDCLPVELRCREVGQGKPRRCGDFGSVDHAEVERQGKTYQYAGDDRHQAENTFAEYRDDQRGQQCRHGNHHGRAVGNQLGTVTGLAHGHVGGNRCHGQANGNDHRADDHRRQQSVDEPGALYLYRQAQECVDEACSHDPAHGRGEAELALGENDRGNESEARCQEHRHLTAGDHLEQQSSQTCGKQRDIGVEAGNQRHQYQRAKGYEEHLRTGDDLAPERVLELIRHYQASFCLVPKILSPASPRPGMM
ncbi:hypothetical protein D9M71_322150 [compost metagenome]